PDGTISVTDNNNKEFKLIDDKEVHKCRETLCKLADSQIADPVQLAKFYGDVTRFEDRVTTQIESNLRRSGLSSEQAQTDAHAQVKQTYRDLTKLLESPNKENIELGASRKMQVVRQIMQQAADPRCIDQGNHPTCNVTDVEIRTYARTPAEATKLVVDLLVDGQYQAKGEKYQSTGDGKRQGVIVSLDNESLKPHGSAKQVLNQDGERSYASQIFQTAAINIGYKLEYRKESYRQVEPNHGITDDANDNNDGGDRFVRRAVAGIAKEIPVQDPNIKDKLIVQIGNAISGTDKGDWLINYGIPNEGPATSVDSPEMLWQKLKDAKEQGNFPIVIGIDAMHEPFLSDAGLNPRNRSQENGSGHVVLATDIVEGPPESVLIDDTNGTKHDHILKPVPLTDMYFSLRPASDRQSVQEQESLLRSMRRAGKQNELQELDCLALRQDHGLITSQEYLTELAQARTAHKAIDEMTVRNMPEAKIFRHMQIDRKIDNLCAQLPLDEHFKILEDQDKTDPRFQQSMLNAYKAAQDLTLTILDPEQGQPGDFIALNGFVNSYKHFTDFLETCNPEIQDQAKAIMKEAEVHSQY
ncbi:MAG: hypothetical protein K2X81_04880, partial [Candidatus Obscuribacterales bacterium]|nr:hypothetical protein [Candidatus Obscuribacterales bacterium]